MTNLEPDYVLLQRLTTQKGLQPYDLGVASIRGAHYRRAMKLASHEHAD
jgi:hypothetical protein